MMDTCSGLIGTWDVKTKYKLCLELCKRGHPEGTYLLADCYSGGYGTAYNQEKAMEIYHLAADRGSSDAMDYIGRQYYYDKDYKKALEMFLKAAELGNDRAAYNAAGIYAKGWGEVQQDESKAFYWYNKSAMLDNQLAQFECGECYRRGVGTEPDPEKAVYWYEKALDQRCDFDIYKDIARIYFYGDGIKANLERAIWILQVLAKKNCSEAKEALEEWNEEQELFQSFDCPKKITLQKDPAEECTKSIEELLMAAKEGDIEAQYICGYMYDNGRGVEQNLDQALQWYQKAARKGYVRAQEKLSDLLLYLDEEVKVKDRFKQAIYWAEAAAEQGSYLGQKRLAKEYAIGELRPKDSKKAFYWYKKAAEQGYAPAQYYCGVYIYNGIEVKKNRFTAKRWFELAAEQGYTDAICALKEKNFFL